MDQNFLDLLQLFDAHKVKYLIIGGYAVSYYAEPRYTKDLDFWIECSVVNGRRIIAALEEFGAPLATITAKDFASPGVAYTAGLPPLRFDILTRVKGADFKTAYKNRLRTSLNGIPVHYVVAAEKGRKTLIPHEKNYFFSCGILQHLRQSASNVAISAGTADHGWSARCRKAAGRRAKNGVFSAWSRAEKPRRAFSAPTTYLLRC